MSLYFTSLLDQDGPGRPVNPPGRSQQLIGTTSTEISKSGGIWCTTGRSHRIPADSMYGLEIFSSHLFNSFACVRFISLHAGIVLRDQHARSFYLFPVACNLFFFLGVFRMQASFHHIHMHTWAAAARMRIPPPIS
jgi:hypothetical protein